jgi:hypothetical protein
LLDIGNLYFNCFSTFDFGSADRQAVGVGQQQPHRLHVAGIRQFAEFFGESLAIDGLPENRAQFFSRARPPAWITAAALLP